VRGGGRSSVRRGWCCRGTWLVDLVVGKGRVWAGERLEGGFDQECWVDKGVWFLKGRQYDGYSVV